MIREGTERLFWIRLIYKLWPNQSGRIDSQQYLCYHDIYVFQSTILKIIQLSVNDTPIKTFHHSPTQTKINKYDPRSNESNFEFTYTVPPIYVAHTTKITQYDIRQWISVYSRKCDSALTQSNLALTDTIELTPTTSDNSGSLHYRTLLFESNKS